MNVIILLDGTYGVGKSTVVITNGTAVDVVLWKYQIDGETT